MRLRHFALAAAMTAAVLLSGGMTGSVSAAGMPAEDAVDQVSVFPTGEKNPYGAYFTGQSYLQMLVTEDVPIGNVTFEPGCRNFWHIHHGSKQILLVTGGRGYYQEWGKEPRELHPGDVVEVPPEVKHWHGAAPDSWFSHLSVEVAGEGASNEWCEPVSDEEYGQVR